MKNSPSVGQLGTAIAHFLHRYHIILYATTIVIAVSVAIFLISGIFTSLGATEVTTSNDLTTFDSATIKRIDEYNSSSQQAKPFSLPSGGRINPFVE